MRRPVKIAAYYSKGKNSSSVPVNYTLVKTLKKPTGSKPGKVILDNYKTIYIDPDDEFLQELTKKYPDKLIVAIIPDSGERYLSVW